MRVFNRFSLIPILLAAAGLGCSASQDKPSDIFEPDDTGATTDADDGGTTFDIGDNEGGLPGGDLAIDPINAVVYIDIGKMPLAGGTQTFTVTESGTDVSSGTTFTLEDPSLGSFADNVFTSATDLGKDGAGKDILGKTTVATGTAPDGKKGQTKITVVKLRKTEDPVTSARDFFFTIPYKLAPDPSEDVLKFTTNIQQIDVAFVTDTTGSMGGAISNINANLSKTIIPALKAAIPSVGIAVVDHKDVPVSPYGSSGDFPAKVWAPITVQKDAAALTLVQNAVGKYAASGGNDGPESQIPAMYYTLTGKGFSWSGGSLPTVTPAPGTTGAVNFRSGAVPIIVLTTDVDWHNGVGAAYSGFTAPNLTQLKDAFKAANAKFVGTFVDYGGTGAGTPWPDGISLSDATSSNLPPSAFDGPGKPSGCGTGQCCTLANGAGRSPDAPGGRCRLNFSAGSSGSGVSTSVVNAIKALASGSVYDILPQVSNDPANPDMVDATQFIDRLEAFADMSTGCAGTPRKSTSSMTYNDMVGGIVAGKQTACFKVIPKQNDTVAPKEIAQFFKAFINMKGVAPGVDVTPTTPLVDLGDTRTVLFLVPPTAPIPK